MVERFHVGDLDVLSPSCLQFLLRYFRRQLDNQFPFVTQQCRWEEKERGDCILREEDTVSEAMLLVTGRLRSTHKQLHDGSKYKLQYRLSYDGGRCFSEREKDEMTRKMQVRSSEEMVSGWNDGKNGDDGKNGNNASMTNNTIPTTHRSNESPSPKTTPDEVVVSVGNKHPLPPVGIRKRHSSLYEPVHQRGEGNSQPLLQ